MPLDRSLGEPWAVLTGTLRQSTPTLQRESTQSNQLVERLRKQAEAPLVEDAKRAADLLRDQARRTADASTANEHCRTVLQEVADYLRVCADVYGAEPTLALSEIRIPKARDIELLQGLASQMRDLTVAAERDAEVWTTVDAVGAHCRRTFARICNG
ncbi:hypothetical protein ADK75_36310 [Streptomyces virginiae]|uniref:Uncharacterized protein n=1 Tax=Streptomyces virginiae TaxID=1961 RepID=A0A0L8M1P1_STRVG|nr:hypothetical protein ADK75_36310 [Streptomyces virginiae]